MGAVKIDIHRRERAMSSKFDYNTVQGVTSILRSIERLRTLRKNGSFDAAIILIDVTDAINRCGLSPQERMTVNYCYLDGLTQQQAADKMAVPRGTIAYYVSQAIDKVQRHMAGVAA
jgi:RNA polymerase sigma factor (sigma-70 family)